MMDRQNQQQSAAQSRPIQNIGRDKAKWVRNYAEYFAHHHPPNPRFHRIVDYFSACGTWPLPVVYLANPYGEFIRKGGRIAARIGPRKSPASSVICSICRMRPMTWLSGRRGEVLCVHPLFHLVAGLCMGTNYWNAGLSLSRNSVSPGTAAYPETCADSYRKSPSAGADWLGPFYVRRCIGMHLPRSARRGATGPEAELWHYAGALPGGCDADQNVTPCGAVLACGSTGLLTLRL